MNKHKLAMLIMVALFTGALINGEEKKPRDQSENSVSPKVVHPVIAPKKAGAVSETLAASSAVPAARIENKDANVVKPMVPTSAGQGAAPITTVDGVGAMGSVEPKGKVLCLHPMGQGSQVVFEMKVKEGDPVTKGQILATLSDFPIKNSECRIYKIEWNMAKKDFELAKSQMNRSQKLNKSLSISEKEMEIQRFKLEKATQDVEIAAEKLRGCEIALMQAQVCAPTDGTILHIYSQVGEKIGEQGLLLMANLAEIEIIAEVHETDISRVYIGQKVEISFPNQSSIPMIGHVYYKGHMVSPNTVRDLNPKGSQDLRVIPVRIKLAPEDCKNLENSLKMYVDVRFSTNGEDDNSSRMVLPRSIQPRVV